MSMSTISAASQVSTFSLSSASADSALNLRSYTSHTPHTAHPVPLREQAFTLHCQGLRSPAIAAGLGVSERTIRSWIAAALAELKDDLQLSRKEQLLLAVERQHQLTAIAWQQFEAEAAARDALLDAALETLLSAANPSSDAAGPSTRPSTPTRPLHLHLPASTPAPRYLSLILQANKETNRLLGLHTLAKLHLLTPESPDIAPTDTDSAAESATAFADLDIESSAESTTAGTNSRIPAKTATAANSHIPAESATVSESAQADFVAAGPPGAVSTAGSPPAESAAAPTTPCLSVSSVSSVVYRPIPAKTATAPTGLAAGIGTPANPHPPLTPLPANPLHHIPAESATTSDLPSCSSSPFVSSVLNLRPPAELATYSPLSHGERGQGVRSPLSP